MSFAVASSRSSAALTNAPMDAVVDDVDDDVASVRAENRPSDIAVGASESVVGASKQSFLTVPHFSTHTVMKTSRAYLDIDIDAHREKHARACAFVDATDLRYGFSSKTLAELGGSEKARVPELYASDYEWCERGPIELEPATRERVVIELYDEKCPLAVENFKALCTGEKGTSKASGAMMSYKNVRFHRVVSGFMMQGGDFTHQNGAGGESVYGKKFKDDVGGLKMKHDGMGVVSMGNTGKNSNSSQFFITFGACKQLDGKHVVFGRVVEGMEVIERINEECAVLPGGTTEEPKVPVVVVDCGLC